MTQISIINMVMTFTLTTLSHYNSIIESRAHFLLFLMEDLSIDFFPHFITFILDVYLDTATRNKIYFRTKIIVLIDTKNDV